MNANRPVSKVLVLDDDPGQAAMLERFCGENNLIALTVRDGRLSSALRPALPVILRRSPDLF